ncbi:hypothetical protein HDU92_004708 [Lobulomyces angularis]|nr:hypothetical protein HDU92_004708 [Lobulomyces angularis]
MNVNQIKDVDLANMMGMKVKDLQILAGKLKSDGMIKFETKTEELGQQEGFVSYGDGNNAVAKRKIAKSYYYIDYKQFIDIVKWKIHKISKLIELEVLDHPQSFSYLCPVCRKNFKMLEITHLVNDLEGFKCDVCDNYLQQAKENVAANSDKYSKFMSETSPILNLLKETDDLIIPEFEFGIDKSFNSQNHTMNQQGTDIKVSSETGAIQSEIVVEVLNDVKLQNLEKEDEEIAEHYENLMRQMEVKMEEEKLMKQEREMAEKQAYTFVGDEDGDSSDDDEDDDQFETV